METNNDPKLSDNFWT